MACTEVSQAPTATPVATFPVLQEYSQSDKPLMSKSIQFSVAKSVQFPDLNTLALGEPIWVLSEAGAQLSREPEPPVRVLVIWRRQIEVMDKVIAVHGHRRLI